MSAPTENKAVEAAAPAVAVPAAAAQAAQAAPVAAAETATDAAPVVAETTPAAATEAVPAEAAAAVPGAAAETKEAAPEAAAATAAATTAATEASPADAAPEEPVLPASKLWEAVKDAEYKEMWGVNLEDPVNHVPSQVVLQKFLNANDGDFAKAEAQLVSALKWRQETKPAELVKAQHSRVKFGGLGYVTTYYSGTKAEYTEAEPEKREVVSWNMYGNVKSLETSFGDLEEFINWRTALMELAVAELSLATAEKQITAEYDPYKMIQVHDYKNTSFLRQSSKVRAGGAKTIAVFSANYPELLKHKYFVNTPAIMSALHTFFKYLAPSKTVQKFHLISKSTNLGKELTASPVADLAQKLPQVYGGEADDLTEANATTTLFFDEPVEVEATAPAEATTEAAAPAAPDAPDAKAPAEAAAAATEATPAAAPAAADAAAATEATPAPAEKTA